MNSIGPDVARVPGLWAPVVAPYTALREPLADAEWQLNSPIAGVSTPLWSRLGEVADDQGQVREAVDALLATTVIGWSLGEVDARSKISLVGGPGVGTTELAAVQALALLVESGGADRVKRCRRGGCEQVLLDRTNPGSRRACRAHGGSAR